MGSVCTGMVRIPRADEDALKAAVAIAGPVTVAVDSRHSGFQVGGVRCCVLIFFFFFLSLCLFDFPVVQSNLVYVVPLVTL